MRFAKVAWTEKRRSLNSAGHVFLAVVLLVVHALTDVACYHAKVGSAW